MDDVYVLDVIGAPRRVYLEHFCGYAKPDSTFSYLPRLCKLDATAVLHWHVAKKIFLL